MNVGIIGAGFIGKKRAEAIAHSGSRLVAVADINIERAKSLADSYGCDFTDNWKQIIERDDIGAVIVATSSDMLCRITIEALKARKHVLCEKPLGRDFNEATRMYKAGQNNGILLKTGFNHRFHPMIIKAHELAGNGAIGEIMYIRSVYGHGGREGYDREWRMDPRISLGGELVDQGVHLLDLFRWFMGEFKEVFALNENMFWKTSPLEDNSFILLRTEKGKVSSAHLSNTQWRNKFLFEIFGTAGYLIVDGLGGSYGPERLIYGKREKLGERPVEEIFESRDDGISWKLELEEFFNAINEKRQPLGNSYDGLKANELLSALYESNEQKKVIRITGNL